MCHFLWNKFIMTLLNEFFCSSFQHYMYFTVWFRESKKSSWNKNVQIKIYLKKAVFKISGMQFLENCYHLRFEGISTKLQPSPILGHFHWTRNWEGLVAQWWAHRPLELEVPGSIQEIGKESFASKHAFLHVICKDDMKTVCHSSDRDLNRRPHGGKVTYVQDINKP